MRCYICNSEDDSITFDKLDGRFCPCRTCQAIIFESLADDDSTDLVPAEFDPTPKEKR